MNRTNMNTAKRPAPELLQRPRFSRRKLFRTLPGLAAGFLAGVAVAAEPTTAEPAPLRVGVSPVFPPMVFKQGKELAGVEVDLARTLGEKLGRKVVFVELDWKDQTEALVAGKTDIVMSSMSVTMARNAVMSFTRPYFKIGQMALVRREDRNNHLLGLMVPPGTKVAVIKATTGDFLVQREFPKANRKTYASGAEAARALMKRSVDLFIADSTLVWYLAGTHAADGLTTVPLVLNEEFLAWGVRRGNDDLVGAANEFIAHAAQDGTLTKTFRRWMAVE
jgi:ABC-type amino acid transport substrate-binding protein